MMTKSIIVGLIFGFFAFALLTVIPPLADAIPARFHGTFVGVFAGTATAIAFQLQKKAMLEKAEDDKNPES